MAARAADVAQHALYQFGWRVQMARAGALAEASSSLAGAAMTIQLVACLLLVVVVFLMVAQPF